MYTYHQNANNCGRQFFVCGGASSTRNNAYRAADIDKPRIPSPHSFSALKFPRKQNNLLIFVFSVRLTLCIQ